MNEASTLEQSLLIQLLLKRGLIKQEDLTPIREAMGKSGGSVEDALITVNAATEVDIATAYSEEFRIPLADAGSPLPADKELALKIGESVCRENNFVPLTSEEEDSIKIALVSPTDLRSFERIQLVTGLVAQPVIATASMINV